MISDDLVRKSQNSLKFYKEMNAVNKSIFILHVLSVEVAYVYDKERHFVHHSHYNVTKLSTMHLISNLNFHFQITWSIFNSSYVSRAAVLNTIWIDEGVYFFFIIQISLCHLSNYSLLCCILPFWMGSAFLLQYDLAVKYSLVLQLLVNTIFFLHWQK